MSRARHACGLLLVAGVLTAGPSAGDRAPQDGSVSDYHAKATILLNLFRFTEWPSDSFPSPAAPWVVCIVGADPFGASLAAVFDLREVHQRRFRIDRMGEGDSTAGCHVAFITSADEGRLAAVVGRTNGRPTLTVSDAPSFVNAGGMVMLFNEGGRVRFSINEPAVRASGLRMSALLLSLSRPAPVPVP